MKLHSLTFSHAQFRTLPEAEQIFFLRLAQLRDDLRQTDNLCLSASRTVSQYKGIEGKVALHQLIFAVRLAYGILNEGWNVIQTGWFGVRLSQKYQDNLGTEATASLDFLKRYFSRDNLIRAVRDGFFAHYGDADLIQPLHKIDAQQPPPQHSIVTGHTAANVFYPFAETIRNAAILTQTGESDMRTAVRKFYDEAHAKVSPHFDTFTDAVLRTLIKTLDIKVEAFETDAVTRFDCAPISAIFFDEVLSPQSDASEDC